MIMIMMMMILMMMTPRFIQHLANGTTLSIVTFGMEARLILPPTVVTDTNRETLYGRVSQHVDDNDAHAPKSEIFCDFCQEK